MEAGMYDILSVNAGNVANPQNLIIGSVPLNQP
jgi:hypothetical protein